MAKKLSKKMTHSEMRRLSRKKKIRATVSGTAERPRLTVMRSNKAIYVQLIDDVAGKTLAAASQLSKELKGSTKNTLEGSKAVGKLVAQKASALQIKNCVFDRNGFLYHGKIKALAEGAREGGLQF